MNPSSSALALLRMRLRLIRNLFRGLERDSIAKSIMVCFGLALIIGIGYLVSYHSFQFIETFPAIGVQLNSRLLGLLFLVLFSMVTISTAIVAYTSLFLAKETGFFFENPIPPRLIFFDKMMESTLFSGWATLILCFPVLVAFGNIRRAPPLYYLEAAVLLLLFILFCGAAGTAVTIILLGVVRRWTFRKLMAISALLAATIGWSFLRSFDFAAFNGEDNLLALNRFTMNITALQTPYFPSTWIASGILAATASNHREVAFQAGLLLANTLIFFPILGYYARTVYWRRWVIASEPSPFWSQRAAIREAGRRASAALPGAGSPMGSLIWKDFMTFLRDPAQVSQFSLFLLLTAVYIISLVQIPSSLFAGWRLVIHFSNLTAIALILSSFTSRFLFPLISLEGKAFWIIGLAPIERAFLVRQKVWFGRFLILTLGVAAAVGSSLSLRAGPELTFSAIYTTLLIGWVLTALATGLGAAYPSLSEDNPARIAVGLGGTLNFFASALAVLSLIAIEASPYLVAGNRPPALFVWSSHLAALGLGLAISQATLRVGERSLARMEF